MANQRIFETAAGNSDQKGMGATIVSVWLDERRLSLAHVGDSRVYLLRAGSFDQLTGDHSLVADLVRSGIMTPQQAEVSEQQSILTRALGTKPKVEVDADEQLLLEGDTLLLCSDGLTRMVTDPEIASTLETNLDPQKAADRLVELANENGGQDNVTVIVVHLAPEARGLWATLRRWLRRRFVKARRGGADMARLLLKFESEVVKEVPLSSRPVTIGRAPDNDIPIDNLAVSNYHARVYSEAGCLVIEDLDSLNGTFVNDMRVERATLKDGDSIAVGKHHILVDQGHDTALPLDAFRKAPVPKVQETMVLDTKQQRDLMQQVAAMGERSQIAPGRVRVPTARRPQRPHRSERVRPHGPADRHRQIESGHDKVARMVRAGNGCANPQA